MGQKVFSRMNSVSTVMNGAPAMWRQKAASWVDSVIRFIVGGIADQVPGGKGGGQSPVRWGASIQERQDHP